jgi:G3E family GTPase
MVDAIAGLETLEWSAEARKQIILADRLVVSKCDLAATQGIDRVMERVRLLNSRAAIHTAVEGNLDPLSPRRGRCRRVGVALRFCC